ncbi:MAG TPA: hypothetical protein PKN85_10545, partial [Syntrophorhabdaceae bacterium]|nr:hypothetical protein [Syntrophorhabdaceae bacterium]
AWPGIFPATMRRLPGRLRVTDVRAPSRGGVARMAVQFAAVWIAHGIAFWVFCAAFAPLAWRTVLPVTGAYCLAYVSGLVALIAPGGIGVREEILGAMVDRLASQAEHEYETVIDKEKVFASIISDPETNRMENELFSKWYREGVNLLLKI